MLNELFFVGWPFYIGQWFPHVSGAIWDIVVSRASREATTSHARFSRGFYQLAKNKE